MGKKRRPWNWCRFCRKEIAGADENAAEVKCSGCDKTYTVNSEPTGEGTFKRRLTALPDKKGVAVGDTVTISTKGKDSAIYIRGLGLDWKRPMQVQRNVAGYSRKVVMVKHPDRDEPILLSRMHLCKDTRETERKRSAIRKDLKRAKAEKNQKMLANVPAGELL